MPKVSIIVPVYNTEKYLKKCLESLVNQTLLDIQIIIVNDGSKDNSLEIINYFYNNYKEKIIVLNKENGGLSSSRNFAFSHIKGEYVGFIDSDDFVENNMFEKMYNLAKEEDLDIAECNFSWDFPKKTREDIGISYNNQKSYFVNGRVMACNKIYKTKIILENEIYFPLNLKYEDVEFFYKLIPYVNKYKLINETFYHYIQREDSLANYQNEKNEDIFIILNNILNFYKSNNYYNKYKNELEYLYIRILLGSIFLKTIKIKNKKIRKKLLKKIINELYNKFPNWKKNNILNIEKTKKNKYYKTVNKLTFKFYCIIFKIIEEIKWKINIRK